MKNEKPHALLDTVRDEARLRNDSQLAEHIKVGRDTISRIRNDKLAMSDTVRVKILRHHKMSLRRLDSLLPPDDINPES